MKKDLQKLKLTAKEKHQYIKFLGPIILMFETLLSFSNSLMVDKLIIINNWYVDWNVKTVKTVLSSFSSICH